MGQLADLVTVFNLYLHNLKAVVVSLMLKSISRILRLAARYSENPRAFATKRRGGTPETFWKLDHPWFHELGCKTVLDVGCNEGQFALTARQLLPAARICSFEPIPECVTRVKQLFAKDVKFEIFNCALGEIPGEAHFTVSDVTGASSILEMSVAQARYFPESLIKRTIPVKVETLDSICSQIAIDNPIFLKIDVQGFERQVLAGGRATLSRTKLVMLEASFEPFYEGQVLFDEIYTMLCAAGFSFRESFNMMSAPDNGRALQGDFIFIRR